MKTMYTKNKQRFAQEFVRLFKTNGNKVLIGQTLMLTKTKTKAMLVMNFGQPTISIFTQKKRNKFK